MRAPSTQSGSQHRCARADEAGRETVIGQGEGEALGGVAGDRQARRQYQIVRVVLDGCNNLIEAARLQRAGQVQRVADRTDKIDMNTGQTACSIQKSERREIIGHDEPQHRPRHRLGQRDARARVDKAQIRQAHRRGVGPVIFQDNIAL
jgi:hypothetical protein